MLSMPLSVSIRFKANLPMSVNWAKMLIHCVFISFGAILCKVCTTAIPVIAKQIHRKLHESCFLSLSFLQRFAQKMHFFPKPWLKILKQSQHRPNVELHGSSVASCQVNGKIVLRNWQRCTDVRAMPKVNFLGTVDRFKAGQTLDRTGTISREHWCTSESMSSY